MDKRQAEEALSIIRGVIEKTREDLVATTRARSGWCMRLRTRRPLPPSGALSNDGNCRCSGILCQFAAGVQGPSLLDLLDPDRPPGRPAAVDRRFAGRRGREGGAGAGRRAAHTSLTRQRGRARLTA